MKLAIVVAVGPLHKWGYQHVCCECLASQAEFAERVYMVQSTADATGAELLAARANITFLSSPATWHHRPGATDEVLDVGTPGMAGFTKFHMRNLALGRQAAFQDGYRLILSTHNNWYIPRRNGAALRQYCADFERSGQRTGATWMIAQLHNKLLGPGVRNEGLANLDGLDEEGARAYYPDMKWRHPPIAEIPGNISDICVVDCSYNLLPAEYEGMQRRFGYPGAEHFDWPSYRAVLANRLRRRNAVLNMPLDFWGQQIAAKSGPDWMGYQLLQQVGWL